MIRLFFLFFYISFLIFHMLTKYSALLAKGGSIFKKKKPNKQTSK